MNIKTLGFSLTNLQLTNLVEEFGNNNILKNDIKKNKESKEPAEEDKVSIEVDGYNSKREISSDKSYLDKSKSKESDNEIITITTEMPDSIPIPPKNGVSKTSLDGAVSYTKTVIKDTENNPEGPTYQERIEYDDGTVIYNTYHGDKLSMSIERKFQDENGNPIDADNPEYGDRMLQKIFFYDEEGNVEHVKNNGYEYTSEGWGDFLVSSLFDDIFYDENGNPIDKNDKEWKEKYMDYRKSINDFGLAREIEKQSLIDF